VPCAEYLGDGQQYCTRCEHDSACHIPANAGNERTAD